MQSYLNLIELDTRRQLRLAQFGFFAEKPSFVRDGICFHTDSGWKLFSPESGNLTDYCGELPTPCGNVALRFTTPCVDGIGYCQLLVEHTVVNNFMGGVGSIGAAPLSKDGRFVLYIGYPSREGFE